MTVEKRIEKMEMELARAKHRNRLMLAGVMLTFVLLTAAMTAGVASREDVVRAKRFVVVDVNDKPRASLAVDSDGTKLTLFDKNGKVRVCLGVIEDGPPALFLYDENEKNRVGLGIIEDGPGLVLSDERGNVRASLGVGKNAQELRFFNDNKKTSVGLKGTEDMRVFSMCDNKGNPRTLLSVSKNGPMLSLVDENGTPRACLGINKTTTPNGKIVSYPESSLLLFDPNSNVIWEAPR